MKAITAIILYDDDLCEHYVGAADDLLSEDEKARIAKGLDAKIMQPGGGAEEGRVVSFREIRMASVRDFLLDEELDPLVNIWP